MYLYMYFFSFVIAIMRVGGKRWRSPGFEAPPHGAQRQAAAKSS